MFLIITNIIIVDILFDFTVVTCGEIIRWYFDLKKILKEDFLKILISPILESLPPDKWGIVWLIESKDNIEDLILIIILPIPVSKQNSDYCYLNRYY